MAQLDTPAAGVDSVTSDGAPASNDPIDTIADSFFDEEEQDGEPGGREPAAELEAESRPELVHPYVFFENPFFTRGMLAGNTTLRREPSWFRGR